MTGDNAKLVSVGVDKQIFYWDVATGRTIKRFQGHDFPMNCCKVMGRVLSRPPPSAQEAMLAAIRNHEVFQRVLRRCSSRQRTS